MHNLLYAFQLDILLLDEFLEPRVIVAYVVRLAQLLHELFNLNFVRVAIEFPPFDFFVPE